MRFAKGHGTENDFVVLPDPDGALDLTPALVTRLCDRRAGIGGDGVLRVVRTAAVPEVAALAGEAEWFMDYRNGDGSLAEMCGNGVRVYARYLVEQGLAAAGDLALATRGGVKRVQVPTTGDVTVDMGPARRLEGGPVRVTVDGREHAGVGISMGNPHVVVAVDDLAEAGELRVAPSVAPAAAFPDGTNVEFYVRRGPSAVAMRVHERGAGETRSCGTGACAVAAVAAGDQRGFTYDVDVPGGRVRVTETAGGSLLLSGPAVIVAEGVVSDDWLGR